MRARVALLLGACACAAAPPLPGAAEDARIGTTPELSLRDLDGEEVELPGDGRGRVLLIDVWATWCTPCRKALPEWTRLERELGPGFSVLAISIDDEAQPIRPFLEELAEELGGELRVLLDPGAAISAPVLAYDRVPTVFLVDRRGRIRYVREGWGDDHPAAVERAARDLLLED